MNRGRFGRMEADIPELPGPGSRARLRLLGEARLVLLDLGAPKAAELIAAPLPQEGQR